MKIEHVYIAGPYSSDPEANVETAIYAYLTLIDHGFKPFLPHFSHFAHVRDPRPYEVWMEQDLAWLARCDAVLRLPGLSGGADRELAEAQRLGLPVFLSLPALVDGAAPPTE